MMKWMARGSDIRRQSSWQRRSTRR